MREWYVWIIDVKLSGLYKSIFIKVDRIYI